jgi:hypothetical protein
MDPSCAYRVTSGGRSCKRLSTGGDGHLFPRETAYANGAIPSVFDTAVNSMCATGASRQNRPAIPTRSGIARILQGQNPVFHRFLGPIMQVPYSPKGGHPKGYVESARLRFGLISRTSGLVHHNLVSALQNEHGEASRPRRWTETSTFRSDR